MRLECLCIFALKVAKDASDVAVLLQHVGVQLFSAALEPFVARWTGLVGLGAAFGVEHIALFDVIQQARLVVKF